MLKKLKALKDLNETDPITIRQAILANIDQVVYTFEKDFKIYPISSNEKNGAPGGDRTHDPLLRRQLLYPLSYQGIMLKSHTLSHKLEKSIINSKFFRR